MVRFADQWLYERVLFDYTTGGGASSCACCVFDENSEMDAPPSLIWFGGWRSFLSAIPDLSNAETPEDFDWPQLDSVWADRVKIRHKLLLQQTETVEEELITWLRDTKLAVQNENSISAKPSSVMVIPQEPFFEWIVTGFGIHTIYSHIVYVVMEQVANFHLTNYPSDCEDSEDEMETAWQDCIRWNGDSFIVTLHPAIASLYSVVKSQPTSQWLKGTSRNPAASDRRLVRMLFALYLVEQLRKEYDATMKSAGEPTEQ